MEQASSYDEKRLLLNRVCAADMKMGNNKCKQDLETMSQTLNSR